MSSRPSRSRLALELLEARHMLSVVYEGLGAGALDSLGESFTAAAVELGTADPSVAAQWGGVWQTLGAEEATALARLRLRTTDLAGNPISQVALDEQFYLEALAQDLRPEPFGVASAYLDVYYDSSGVSLVASAEPTQFEFGEFFANVLHGDTTVPGLIDEAGGAFAAGDPFPIPGVADVRVWRVRLRADSLGDYSFAADAADDRGREVTLYGLAREADWSEVELTGTALQIVAPPAAEIAIGDLVTAEGNGGQRQLLIPVMLSPAVAGATVGYATVDGTATTADGDYQSASGTLTFAAGESLQTIAVTVSGDRRLEDNEDFAIQLFAAQGATLASDRGAVTLENDDPPPTLVVPEIVIGESTTAVLRFQLSERSSRTVRVHYETADGSAHAPADYLAQSGDVTLLPGELEQTVTIALVSDTVDEAVERFRVNLSEPENALLGVAGASVSIIDDDASPTLAIDDVALAEGNSGTTDAVFTVALSAASERTVTVSFETADGSATAGVDYASKSGELTFTAGQTTATITVSVAGDALDEPDEEFFVRLHDAISAEIADDEGVGAISDDDPAPALPELSVGDAVVAEGDSGTTDAVFSVSLSAASDVPVTVRFSTADDSASTPDDYLSTSGTLTFAPGETAATITIPIVGDTEPESDETFFLRLTDPTAATLADPEGVGTILYNDFLPNLPTLTIGDASVVEGNSGTSDVVLAVTLSAASESTVTVRFATQDAAAAAPGDFSAASGTLTFLPGVTSQPITVAVVGDRLDEFDEMFRVLLSEPVGAALADASGEVTIVDNDVAPVLAIAGGSRAEGAEQVFNVMLSSASGRPVTVEFATSDRSATSPDDYESRSGTLTFAPGETSQSITVATVGDSLDEANEFLVMTLSGATNATIAIASADGTIVDDDPLPTLAIADASATEGGELTVTVTLSAASGRAVSVVAATADGTASAAEDYVATLRTLTFAPGVTAQSFTVLTLADALDEDDETIRLLLSDSTAATIADGEASGTVLDDDPLPTVSVAAATTSEGESLTFIVSLSAASGRPITVAFSTAAGTAAAPDDFSGSSGALTFDPGETSRSITVATVTDALDETDEQLTIELGAPSNATLATGSASGTIVDDDPPPTLAVADASATEGGELTVTVTLSAASGRAVSVVAATADGTATAAQDYVVTDRTLTFAPGVTAQTFTVSTLADALDEDDEAIRLLLSDPTAATIADGEASGTIADDDPPPTLSIAAATSEEGSTLVFGVTLSAASGRPITVAFSTTAGTAAAPDDFSGSSGALTFDPGETSKAITVATVADALDEADERMTIELGTPSNATLAAASASGTIVDDDPMPQVSIQATSVVEGDSGTTSAVVPVSLSAPSGRTVTVGFMTVAGTATEGVDFAPLAGQLTFLPGQTSQTLTVAIAGDLSAEGDESLSVVLHAPNLAELGSPISAPVTILSDGDVEPPTENLASLVDALQTSPAAAPPAAPTSLLPPPPVSAVTSTARRRLLLPLFSAVGSILSAHSRGGGRAAAAAAANAPPSPGSGRASPGVVANSFFELLGGSGSSDDEAAELLKRLADADQPRLMAIDVGDESVAKQPVSRQAAKPVEVPPAVRLVVPQPPPAVATTSPWVQHLWWLTLGSFAALLGSLGWYYRRRAVGTAGLVKRRDDD